MNLFFAWLETCIKHEVLRNNIKLLRIPLILREILEANEKNPEYEASTILNMKKILKTIE